MPLEKVKMDHGGNLISAYRNTDFSLSEALRPQNFFFGDIFGINYQAQNKTPEKQNLRQALTRLETAKYGKHRLGLDD